MNYFYLFSCSIKTVPFPTAAVSSMLLVVIPVHPAPLLTVKVGAASLAALTPKELPSVAMAVGWVAISSGE